MTTRKRSAASIENAPDLRQRILDASERLIETDGLSALSMREVARRSGVTHQAPYHHFADRESILAELVTQGFDELARRLARANAHGASGDKAALLTASGHAYVGFAIDHPGVFRIMFRPEICDPSRHPDARHAGERAYAELARLVQLLHGAEHADNLASMYWAQVHGLACLIVDGPIGQLRPGVRERRAHMRETLALFTRHIIATLG
jgi:AcrR family transcriptional regulator